VCKLALGVIILTTMAWAQGHYAGCGPRPNCAAEPGEALVTIQAESVDGPVAMTSGRVLVDDRLDAHFVLP
jgi:hypothetical protein